jgi:hypothetical protein
MVWAQTVTGIYAGTGLWSARCSGSGSGQTLSPEYHAGIFLEMPVWKRLTLMPAAEFTFLQHNSGYKVMADTVNFVSTGDGESATNWYQITVPLRLIYNAGNIRPSLGIAYAYRMSESWLHKGFNCFGLTAGIGYRISRHFCLDLQYYHGLTTDFENSGVITRPLTGEYVGNYDYFWKSSRVGLSLTYSFKAGK